MREVDQRLSATIQRAQMRLRRSRGPGGSALLRIGSLLGGFLLLRMRRRPLASSAASVAPDRFTLLVNAALPLLAPLIGLRAAGVLGALATLPTQATQRAPAVAALVDLNLYAGTWHEIARLPTRHERACVDDVTATYRPDGNGIQVINQCRRTSGRIESVTGRARVVDRHSRAKLKVSFAPALLRLLPWAWADYWILDVSPDYRRALVGTPDRRSLWLLSREPSLSEPECRAMLILAAAQGYDTQLVRPTTQHSIR